MEVIFLRVTQLLETPVRTPNLNPEILRKIAEKLDLTFLSDVGAIPCGRPLIPCGLPPYPNDAEQPGQPQGIAPTVNTTFTPIDLLDYIYAELHSPHYRETCKEFLKIDFPRVPYPDPQTLWPLVKLGA